MVVFWWILVVTEQWGQFFSSSRSGFWVVGGGLCFSLVVATKWWLGADLCFPFLKIGFLHVRPNTRNKFPA